MDVQTLKRVVRDQRAELLSPRKQNLVHRNEETLINLESNLAQVVIGVRRSGKSSLCYNALRTSGVNFGYVNFDDERLVELTSNDFDTLLLALYNEYGDFTHLFFDEIQNIENWELFVNRLLRQDIKLVITGSNSKLLSSELSTHLTGRHHLIELFPFSFCDWCIIKGINYTNPTTHEEGLLLHTFQEYLESGGFPELINGKEKPKNYINSLINSILSQDVKRRFNIRNLGLLKQMTSHLLNEAPAFVVKRTLKEIFGIASDQTVSNYLGYLRQTYLITTISRYSTKSRERVRDEKYYPIDVAFMNQRSEALVDVNLGWRLETIVFLELMRRKATSLEDIYYFRHARSEADFVVCQDSIPKAVYQVSYDISQPRTRARELRGCVAAAKATKCNKAFLITYYNSEIVEIDGCTIKILPICEWLTTPPTH